MFTLPQQRACLRWLYVDFNSYFASVEQQLQPHLRGKPIAVVPVETDSTCAIAASYEAKAYGIKTGTPIYLAKQMCPELICVLARHEHYVAFHQAIQEEVERHIPITAVCSIDEVACRLMDNETKLEVALDIADAIKKGLAQNIGEYVKCSIGIAPNKYLAKIATDMQKPDGLVVLHPHELPYRLHSLKLRDLPGVGRNMAIRLHMAGIADMETLLALSPKKMRSVWGNIWGERLWYMLRGIELPEEATKRSTIGHSHVMAPELRAPEQARYVARRLTIKAVSRLRRLGYYATSLSLSVRTENGTRLAAEARCPKAQDTFTFLTMLDALWERMLAGNRGIRLKKVSVTLHRLASTDSKQAELFSSIPNRKHETASQAMDKLNHRFGRDTVLLGMLPSQGRSFSGTKVAFTRIPDIEEFLE
jgi:DNA polymerase IV